VLWDSHKMFRRGQYCCKRSYQVSYNVNAVTGEVNLLRPVRCLLQVLLAIWNMIMPLPSTAALIVGRNCENK